MFIYNGILIILIFIIPWRNNVKLSAVHVHSRVVAHVYKNRFFESSGKNRTWRNLTEDNGRCENPENAVFSRLSAPLCIENAVKIRVRESPPISPSSNGFSEKPIRIFDRTERFFVPKSRFWQCVKRPGYAGLHPKSCRLIRFKKWIFTEFSLFRPWKWKIILNTDNTYPLLK